MITPTETTENIFGPHFRYLSPTVRMSMGIPIVQRTLKDINKLIGRFKAAALESQCLELLPPRFNQVQPTSICGKEPGDGSPAKPTWPSAHRGFCE
jgi:hypothetical protein